MAYFRNMALNMEDFDSTEDYQRALVEQERIEKINDHVDITDPQVARQLYDGFIIHPQMFRTIVGTEFLEVLKENMGELPSTVTEEEIAEAAVVEEAVVEEVVAEEAVEAEPDRENEEAIEESEPEESIDEETIDEETEAEETEAEEVEAEETRAAETKSEEIKTEEIVQKVTSSPKNENLSAAEKGAESSKSRFTYFEMLEYILIAVPLISILFPKAGAILAGIAAVAALIYIWYQYIRSGMKAADLVKSAVCIIVFPAGILLSIIGAVRKKEYIKRMKAPLLCGCGCFFMPVVVYVNTLIWCPQWSVTTLSFVSEKYIEAGAAGRLMVIIDVIILVGLVFVIMGKQAKELTGKLNGYVKEGMTQGQAAAMIMNLPVVVLCMFKELIDGHVLYEEISNQKS